MNLGLWERLASNPGVLIPIDELGVVLGDLDELEALGYPIERHPIAGVAYLGPSPRLVVDQIERPPMPPHIGRRVAVWSRVASTNDLAARAAASRANDGLIVLAEEQTRGRGSRGRAWVAPAGSSILLSALVFPPPGLNDAGWLTALGAVATAEVVGEVTGAEARIKWPNDVRVGGLKVAGVLVERAAGAVLGIGLNVTGGVESSLAASATSMAGLVAGPLDRSEVARRLIHRLDAHYARGLAEGPGPLARCWRDRLELIGRTVQVRTVAGVVDGRLVDVDEALGLIVAGHDGVRRSVAGPTVLSLVPGSAS